MAYQYNQVEAALAHAFGIQPEAIKAFRARLQYLRAQGIPTVQAPGKGRRVEFHRKHIHELTLALELQAIGFEPSMVPDIVKRAMEDGMAGVIEPGWDSPETDVWLLIQPDFLRREPPKIEMGRRETILGVGKVKLRENPRQIVTNISYRARLVWEVLDDVKPAKRGPW